MTTATAAATTTTVAPTAMPTRTRKQGMWASLTSVTKSISNVIGDLAQTGSVASTGLMIQAESYRLEAVEDLIEKYGTAEALAQAQLTANDVIARIRAS